MPLTDQEYDSVLKQVGDLLVREVQQKLTKFSAGAVALTEKQPEQVNNEIRNAITHLTRALTAENLEEAQAQIRLGKGHIERGQRDALKISVITLHDQIATAINQLKLSNGTVEVGFITRRDDLNRNRRDILIAEAEGQPVTENYIQLFVDAGQLKEDILSAANAPDVHKHPIKLWFLLFWRSLAGATSALVLALVAGALLALIIPDPPAFTRKVGAIFHIGGPATPPQSTTSLKVERPTSAPRPSSAPPSSPPPTGR